MTIDIAVEADCAIKVWPPIENLPSYVEVREPESFAVPFKLELDTDGISWSNICSGYAEVTLQGAPSWATIVGSTVTLNPILDSDISATAYAFTVTQSKTPYAD